MILCRFRNCIDSRVCLSTKHWLNGNFIILDRSAAAFPSSVVAITVFVKKAQYQDSLKKDHVHRAGLATQQRIGQSTIAAP